MRYLQQGNVSLVMEALKERGILRRNAPHLVHDLAFVVPNYDWWEAPFYGIGMKVYDLLAVRYGFGKSRHPRKEEVLAHIPTLEQHGLRGGVLYYDGQFDDARLLIDLAQTAEQHGAVLLNYAPVVGLTHDAEGFVDGIAVPGPGIRHATHCPRPLRHQRDRRLQRRHPPDRRPRRRTDDRAEPGRPLDAGRGLSCPATPRSWCPGPATGASCSRSPGTGTR